MTPLLDPVAVAVRVAAILDSLRIRYAVGGAIASTLLGEPRSTNDVDLLVDVTPSRLGDLIRRFEEAGFYVPEAHAVEAVKAHRSFNVVHIDSAIKVDLFVAGRTPLDADELSRCLRVEAPSAGGSILSIAAPEDLIAQKLRWYRDGGEVSDRQWRDVLGLLKVQGPALDRHLLRQSAAVLSVVDLLLRAESQSTAAE